MAVNQQATPELTRVVDYIVAYLPAGGMTHIFGVDGANIEDLFDAAYFRDDITAVLPSMNSPRPPWQTDTAAAALDWAW